MVLDSSNLITINSSCFTYGPSINRFPFKKHVTSTIYCPIGTYLLPAKTLINKLCSKLKGSYLKQKKKVSSHQIAPREFKLSRKIKLIFKNYHSYIQSN